MTAVLSSSSAASVMLVSFVESGYITFHQVCIRVCFTRCVYVCVSRVYVCESRVLLMCVSLVC